MPQIVAENPRQDSNISENQREKPQPGSGALRFAQQFWLVEAGSGPDLATIIKLWPTLPEAVRAEIMALVEGQEHRA
jgi:hypothetical protein